MNRPGTLVLLVVLVGAFAAFLLVRLGPRSLLLVEPLVGFGLGFLAAMYLNRRIMAENRQLQQEVRALAAENKELHEVVDKVLEDNDV